MTITAERETLTVSPSKRRTPPAVSPTERGTPTIPPAADPAPLGLAAFALTTFVLSGHNATFIPDGIWVGLALFYGGLVQLLAGMWEFRNRNVFGATAFSSYGGFWLSLGMFLVLVTSSNGFAGLFNGSDLHNSLAWLMIAFAIFNTYMLLWSTRVNGSATAVFLALEITEILLVIGFFRDGSRKGPTSGLHAGGWAGIVTAAASPGTPRRRGWSTGWHPSPVLPVGPALWAQPAGRRNRDH